MRVKILRIDLRKKWSCPNLQFSDLYSYKGFKIDILKLECFQPILNKNALI